MTLSDTHVPHLIAVLWFILCWVGYTRYADWRGAIPPAASVMHLYRQDWMQRLLVRENRIADANVIGNRNATPRFRLQHADHPRGHPDCAGRVRPRGFAAGRSAVRATCQPRAFGDQAAVPRGGFRLCVLHLQLVHAPVQLRRRAGGLRSDGGERNVAIRSAELSPIGLHGSSPWRPTSSTSACAPTISAWRRWLVYPSVVLHACHRWRGAHSLSPGVPFQRARGDGIHANFADRIARE